jgi:hypothetical protein
MAKKKPPKSPKPPQSAQPAPADNPALQLLLSTLTDLVVEMVEAKCQTITNRERKTLERRIDKAIRLFVEGQK